MSKSNRNVYRIKLTAEERVVFEEVSRGKLLLMAVPAGRCSYSLTNWSNSRDPLPMRSTRQCFTDRVSSQTLATEGIETWFQDRNKCQKGIWQFKNKKARLKLKTIRLASSW